MNSKFTFGQNVMYCGKKYTVSEISKSGTYRLIGYHDDFNCAMEIHANESDLSLPNESKQLDIQDLIALSRFCRSRASALKHEAYELQDNQKFDKAMDRLNEVDVFSQYDELITDRLLGILGKEFGG